MNSVPWPSKTSKVQIKNTSEFLCWIFQNISIFYARHKDDFHRKITRNITRVPLTLVLPSDMARVLLRRSQHSKPVVVRARKIAMVMPLGAIMVGVGPRGVSIGPRACHWRGPSADSTGGQQLGYRSLPSGRGTTCSVEAQGVGILICFFLKFTSIYLSLPTRVGIQLWKLRFLTKFGIILKSFKFWKFSTFKNVWNLEIWKKKIFSDHCWTKCGLDCLSTFRKIQFLNEKGHSTDRCVLLSSQLPGLK